MSGTQLGAAWPLPAPSSRLFERKRPLPALVCKPTLPPFSSRAAENDALGRLTQLTRYDERFFDDGATTAGLVWLVRPRHLLGRCEEGRS